MRKRTALALTVVLILAVGCGRQSAPALLPESSPLSGTSQESAAAAPSQDPRARLTRALPVQLAPDLLAIVATLPEGEQPSQGGPLLVTTEGGRVLLERTTGVVALVGVRQAGAALPLLVLEVAGGGSMGSYYEAYRYDRDQDQLVRVPWESQTIAVSTSGVEQAGDLLRTTGRSEAAVGRRVVTILWQYRDGALERVRTEFSPPPYPDNDKGVLLLAFDTVAKRLPAQGPVFIWTPDRKMHLPPSRLFAVTPHFRAGPLGPQITAVTATLLTLRVPDAAAAVQLLKEQSELQQRSIPEPEFQGGFWAVQVPDAGVWRINPRAGEVQHSQPGDAKDAETFVREILLAQYTRPVRSDAQAKLAQAYSTAHDEVSRERTRVLNDLTDDQTAMENRKAAYRDSKVRIRFRSLEANGNEIYGVVEVLADWHWGYDGKPLETPTQVYNLHEFKLTHTGERRQVILDRNLASNPKTQVQVTPLQWSD